MLSYQERLKFDIRVLLFYPITAAGGGFSKRFQLFLMPITTAAGVCARAAPGHHFRQLNDRRTARAASDAAPATGFW